MSSAPLEKSAVEPVAITPPTREPGQVDVEYHWQGNNRVELLENGEEYFPRVFAAMRAAKSEILLETFIVFEDKVGAELQEILIDAAQRGVRTTVSFDGFGCGELTTGYLTALSEAGVHLQIFDPAPKHLGIRTNWFRRLHRKIVVVDGLVAFVGGINFPVITWPTSAPKPSRIMRWKFRARRSPTSIISPCCKAVVPDVHGSGGNAGASGVRKWPSTISMAKCVWCSVTTINTTPISRMCTYRYCAAPNAAW